MLNPLQYTPKKISSIREMMDLAVAEAGDKIAYRYHGSGDSIIDVTFREFNEITENMGAALTEMGFGEAHIACIGENSFDWICVYLTVLKGGGVYVPIDKDLISEEKIHLLTESDSTVVFFSKRYESWVRENMDKLPDIEYYIGFDQDEDEGKLLSYKKLLSRGSECDRGAYDALHSGENELKMLVYTSGTTGVAKGVMLSEHNLVSSVYYGLQVSQIYDCGLSVLPYHHTYEAVCDILVSLHYHSTLCITSAMKNVIKDLHTFKPSYIYLVPAFAELLYSNINKNIAKQGKESQFRMLIKVSNLLLKCGIDLRRKFFRSIHEVFGGRLIKIVCGGAPIRPEVGKFFGDVGLYLVGGYGITECSPLVAVNHERCNTYDTVGKRLPCLEWFIDNPDEDGIGEICVKGDVVMLGYYKQPEKTAEVLRDGWFYTGDYGYITSNDQLVITGRKKNIIVLNSGKNIYPEEIENYIQNIDYVSEVVVSGLKNEHGDEHSLQAEIYIDPGEPRFSELDEKTVLQDVQDKLHDLPAYKKVTKVELRSEPFVKTSSNKIKR